MNAIRTTFLSCLAALFFAGTLTAQVAFDESVSGDISDDPSNPTPVTFSPGSNLIVGELRNDAADSDVRDFITFNIGPGQTLVAINQLSYADAVTGGTANTGFNAIINGSISFDPAGGMIGNFLGGNHFNSAENGTDILPGLSGAPGIPTIGFTAPLGPGAYTYHVQQTSSNPSTYELDFVVVPEPGSVMLTLLALSGVFLVRRRR